MLLTIIVKILKRRRYLAIAGATTLIMLGLSYYLMVFNITGKSITAYAVMNGVWYTTVSLALSVFISIFSGIYTAVWLLRRSIVKQKNKSAGAIMGTGGALGGILAAGCPTCGAPLLALLGAPLALMSLPFKGLELKAISLILLFLSIYWLTENIYRQLSCACKIIASTSKSSL